MDTLQKDSANLRTYKKRIELLVGARFKEVNRIISGAKIQDKLREKIGHWQGAEEIRKWRMRN